MPGEMSEEKAPDGDVQKIVDQIRAKVEEQVERKFDEFTAVKCNIQWYLVPDHGMYYFIKVKVGGEEYIHLRVYVLVQQHLELRECKTGKKIDDPIPVGYYTRSGLND